MNSKQIKDLNAAFERDKMLTTKFERQIEEVKRHQDSPHLSLLYYSIKQFLGADHLLMAILKEVLLSGLVDGEEEKRETASLMKQESKDGVQYNFFDFWITLLEKRYVLVYNIGAVYLLNFWITLLEQARKLQATLVRVRNYDRPTDSLTDGGEV